jgi:dsRNA-specific ribonuclease
METTKKRGIIRHGDDDEQPARNKKHLLRNGEQEDNVHEEDESPAPLSLPDILDDEDVKKVHGTNRTYFYVFDPYNPLNQSMDRADVETILRQYGVDVPVFNMELFKRAFVHRSHVKRPEAEYARHRIHFAPKPENCLPLYTKSNERLEFVGDGVLECITKYYLYRRFPKENEGFMTEKKIELVKNESIGKMAMEMGLHKWFILSKHAESKQTRTNLRKLGCLFESFLGALFLDFNKVGIDDTDRWFETKFLCGPGFQMAQIFVEAVFEKHVDWTNLICHDSNYKNILQVIIQKEFKVTPHYIEKNGLTVLEPTEGTEYEMGVYLCLGQAIHEVTVQTATPLREFATLDALHHRMSNDRKIFVCFGEGKHRVKKKAEQIACEMAIRLLKEM